MEVKTYPHPREAEGMRVGRHTAYLADTIHNMMQRMMASIRVMEVIAVERDDSSLERVEDVVTSIVASIAISIAASSAKNVGKQFDPEAFGAYVAEFGRMMLPTFQAIDESDAATKN